VIGYRRARQDDFAAIADLQNKNLAWNLAADERAEGFLSTAFSIDQFRQMDQEVAVIVALDGAQLCGYICASTPAFNMSMPFPAAMLKHASGIVYDGKALMDRRLCVTSPICIDRAHRGRGIYLGLCRTMIGLIAGRYDLAVAFVSTANERHLRAVSKMAFDRLGEFEKDGHRFLLIVYPLPSPGEAGRMLHPAMGRAPGPGSAEPE
jgi:ribosomal protein S18 acetylase RimI-like enzyme